MSRKRGLAGLTGVAAALLVGALAPSSAMAHPCISEVNASLGKTLTLHSGGNWAGSMPAFEDLEHECAEDLNSELYQSVAVADAAADPVQDAVSTFAIKNLTPLGYSARAVPLTGTGSGTYNSDLAFKDNLIIAGTYEGFRILDGTDPANPTQIINYTGCTVGQGDVIVYENLLIRSWDAPASASSTCAGQAVGTGFEGIHIFDISNPAAPVMVRQLRMAATGNEAGAPTGCGSHTATAVPDKARGYLYIYNGASSGSCRGIDVVRISLADPTDAKFLRRVSHEVPTRTGNNSCHDNNVLMGVGGSTKGYAMCAGGNGLAMYGFDMGKAADHVGTGPEDFGGVENPTLLWSKSMGVTTGHSGSFTYDGKMLIYGHEPGGGSQAQCQATSSTLNKTLFFMDPLTGDVKGTMVHPRPQTNRENCTWHNFNVVPTKAGYYVVSGNYQSGISVLDFTNPAAIKEIAYADPAPLSDTSLILGGDWSTYWHNGYIYESDIKRGVITWKLNLGGTEFDQAAKHLARTNTVAVSNPQTQTMAIAPDNAAPTVTSADNGKGYLQGSTQAAAFSCADDGGTGVESCTANVTNLDTSAIGYHTYTVTAMDNAGNVTTQEIEYMVNSTATTGGAGASVAATLGLGMGPQASFGAFVPGVARTYTATTSANVVSTAGDALLSVSDASSTNTGKLVNGAFTLAQPMMVSAASAGGTSSAAAAVGGSSAPTSVLSYSGPVSNDNVTITFSQSVGANEGLRTGAYNKALTFTLSTTTP